MLNTHLSYTAYESLWSSSAGWDSNSWVNTSHIQGQSKVQAYCTAWRWSCVQGKNKEGKISTLEKNKTICILIWCTGIYCIIVLFHFCFVANFVFITLWSYLTCVCIPFFTFSRVFTLYKSYFKKHHPSLPELKLGVWVDVLNWLKYKIIILNVIFMSSVTDIFGQQVK